MSNKYKLLINGSWYWSVVYKDKKMYFEKTNKPCHIYVEKTEPFITDKMICNYKDASGINYLWTRNPLGTRLREHKDYIIIEPSGIMVPKSEILLANNDKIEKDKGFDISEITRTSYYCNLISDTTRGGRDSLSYEEVKVYRDQLINQSSKILNPSFLTPFEFAYMFIITCYKKGITSFSTDKLLINIIEKYNSKPEYLPLLWNIDYTCGEHYDKSDDLFNAFALLRYIGLIYPNYDSESQYDDLIIDNNIDKYSSIIKEKEGYLPLIEQFVKEHLGLTKNEDKRLRKFLKRYNIKND